MDKELAVVKGRRSIVEELEGIVFRLNRPPEVRVPVCISFALYMQYGMEDNVLIALSEQNKS